MHIKYRIALSYILGLFLLSYEVAASDKGQGSTGWRRVEPTRNIVNERQPATPAYAATHLRRKYLGIVLYDGVSENRGTPDHFFVRVLRQEIDGGYTQQIRTDAFVVRLPAALYKYPADLKKLPGSLIEFEHLIESRELKKNDKAGMVYEIPSLPMFSRIALDTLTQEERQLVEYEKRKKERN